MRDFDWYKTLYAVIKEDGTYAGIPCLTWEEARELSNQHEGSRIFELVLDEDEDPYDEPNCDYDMGFDPYLGCYTDDC